MTALPWDALACTCPPVECICPTAQHDRHCPVHGDRDAVTAAVTFDPECPEHRLTDPSPASSPAAVTVYCGECGGPSDVVDESSEDVTYLDQVVRTLWVRRLDCGHDEVTER